jgi:hypothetical protein
VSPGEFPPSGILEFLIVSLHKLLGVKLKFPQQATLRGGSELGLKSGGGWSCHYSEQESSLISLVLQKQASREICLCCGKCLCGIWRGVVGQWLKRRAFKLEQE